jgi:hypothetical protein
MRTSGATSNQSWRPVRRGAALLALAPLLVVAGLASPAHAATDKTDTATSATSATTATSATSAPTPTTPPATGGAPAPDKAAPAAPAAAAADGSSVNPGDPGTENLTGEPGKCDDEGCGRLQPVVECSFKDPGTGLYNTVWSYQGGSIPVKIPPGWFNFYFPGAVNRGQPTLFTPGYHRSVLITTHKGPLTWVLGLRKATAPGRPCQHNPVPVTGAGLSSIVTLFAVGGLLGVVLLVRSRRRRSIRV